LQIVGIPSDLVGPVLVASRFTCTYFTVLRARFY